MNTDAIEIRFFQRNELPDHLIQILDHSPDHLSRNDGKIYLAAGKSVICCADNETGNKLVGLIAGDYSKKAEPPEGPGQIMWKIIRDERYIPDSKELLLYRIKAEERRCAAVFRTAVSMEKDLISVFQTLVPTEQNDIVISVDDQTVVLIRSLKHQSFEELNEYTEAVLGTMESEGVPDIMAGIGRPAETLYELRNSFHEAMEAIELGIRYSSRDHVFVFARQGLERILECIPPEKKREIRHRMFGDFSAEKLSDEILETARVFFLNDLNLTAASRQLFIHRNTLNYRLDKIRKDFGLDLRSFHDALIFRIATGIPDEQ